jgi:hypothetical protein
MALIKLLVAPIRRIVSFPLFQLLATIAVILFLQAADSTSVRGEIFSALDVIVDYTVSMCTAIFEVKSFTRSWLIAGFMIAYVYIAGLLIVLLAKAITGYVVELVARINAFGLRNAIARERGIAAYRAWLPLESIRPAHIAQEKWEERFAWPSDDGPPTRRLHTGWPEGPRTRLQTYCMPAGGKRPVLANLTIAGGRRRRSNRHAWCSGSRDRQRR